MAQFSPILVSNPYTVMKFLILFFALISINQNISAQEAKFSVDKSVHKFPKSKEGIVLEHQFNVTNTGTVPLIISDYKVACECTKLFLPKKPIAPGETVAIKVTFDTTGKSYFQDRTIYLSTNTKKKEETLRIKVNVE